MCLSIYIFLSQTLVYQKSLSNFQETVTLSRVGGRCANGSGFRSQGHCMTTMTIVVMKYRGMSWHDRQRHIAFMANPLPYLYNSSYCINTATEMVGNELCCLSHHIYLYYIAPYCNNSKALWSAVLCEPDAANITCQYNNITYNMSLESAYLTKVKILNFIVTLISYTVCVTRLQRNYWLLSCCLMFLFGQIVGWWCNRSSWYTSCIGP